MFSVTPLKPKPQDTVTVDASASFDANGTITGYRVDYGDGTIASGAVTTHRYVKEGDYKITVTVTDNDGKTGSLAKKIVVSNVVIPPVVVTKEKHFDNMCWKIVTAGGTWYFENGETAGKSGFSSAFDQAGNDWIGNDADKGYNTSPSFGGKHEYRGWPNFGNQNFDHPQRSSGTTTRWVDASGNTIPFVDKLEGSHLIMRSANATYELEYHFFPTHAAIKVLKAGSNYAFLYEGPIGGEQEKTLDKDYYVLKDGTPRLLNRTQPMGGLGYIDPEFGTAKQFPSPFFYFVDTDPKDTQVFYVGAKNLAPATYGDEGWMQCNAQGANMVVFSFGRKNDARSLTGTNAICVFGFLPKADGHAAISAFIEARLLDPFNPVP
jgi:hypothetical protein